MKGAIVLVALVMFGGCGGNGGDRATIYAASSLTEAFQQLDHDARFQFGGSDELAFQIEQGANPDVYASASPKYTARLFSKGLGDRPRTFATNRLVLIVANSAGRGTSLGGIENPNLKLVLAAPGVPAGDYARSVMAAICAHSRPYGLRPRCPSAKVVSEEPDVKGVVAKVALGEADLGFVYATDAKAAGTKVRTVAVPAALQPPIDYAIAVAKDPPHPGAAERFVDLVLSSKGQAALRAAGFGTP